MKYTNISNILKGNIPYNTNVIINGWVRSRRDSKIGISFINIYDGSCLSQLQSIANKKLPNYYKEIMHLTIGCSVQITGILLKSLGNKQKYEINILSLRVLGWIKDPETYPIAAKKHSLEHLRSVAHLRPRTNLIGSISRIKHITMISIHKFMDKQGFFWIPTPIITFSNAEGAGETFKIFSSKLSYCNNDSFFKKQAFLTVSGQLNGECYACALSKVYTFGPVFRAENSNTRRHLAEFWMIEPEIAFANLEDIIFFSEKFLKNIFQSILDKCNDDIQFLSKYHNINITDRLLKFINKKIINIEYNEVIKILKKNQKNFKNSINWGINLSIEHEKYLTEEYFKSPIIIKNFPKHIKAFYMRVNEDNKTVASMDLILPYIGEVIGGSQREERLLKLDKRISEMHLSKEEYYWYRDLRKYGTVPHAGFGLGLERLISYITGTKNVRDISPFPRTTNSTIF